MTATINYNEITTLNMGRNGHSKSKGIDLMQCQNGNILLTPITSKGNLQNCEIEIHKDSIPELINQLQKLLQ
jgi:hypothetical protein